MVCNVHVHCINNNVGDKPLVVICNVDTKPQGIPCLFSSDNLPAKRCIHLSELFTYPNKFSRPVATGVRISEDLLYLHIRKPRADIHFPFLFSVFHFPLSNFYF